MTIQRIDQSMAAAAARALPDSIDGELRTRYRQLRVMLNTAGLAATYAFIASKAADSSAGGDGEDKLGRAYRDAAEAIKVRLADLGLLSGDLRQMSVRQVMSQLADMDAARYARASAEASAFAAWLSRLADAVYLERAGDA